MVSPTIKNFVNSGCFKQTISINIRKPFMLTRMFLPKHKRFPSILSTQKVEYESINSYIIRSKLCNTNCISQKYKSALLPSEKGSCSIKSVILPTQISVRIIRSDDFIRLDFTKFQSNCVKLNIYFMERLKLHGRVPLMHNSMIFFFKNVTDFTFEEL